MKHIVYISVMVLIISLVFVSQNNLHPQDCELAMGLKPGKAYSFGDKVNVRAMPITTAQVVVQLNIGDELFVLQKTDKTTTLDGVREFWYKIRAGNKTGYMWGGLISCYAIHGNLDNDPQKELVLFRNVQNRERLDLRLVENKKMTAMLSRNYFRSNNKDFKHTVIKDSGFTPSITFFSFYSFQRSEIECGDFISEYFFIHNGKIKHLLSHSTGSCDPPSCFESKLIFPSQKGGKRNAVIERSRTYNTDDPKVNEVNTVEYTWNGSGFSSD